jgi:formylglycine-generating enzyme required for sulfatase activity
MRILAGVIVLWVGVAAGEEFVNSAGMRMVRVPAGTFAMGESAAVTDALLDPLTYPRRSEMARLFPKADPQSFVLPFEAARHGDFDERPVHQVRISKPFFVGAFEVTNAQYEQFDPGHKALRGKHGFSKGDDEAVVFVSWEEARAFCAWLTKKEGKPYRLPTEAEWEYMARAGTTSLYSTGDSLPAEFLKNARSTEFEEAADVVPLTVGRTRANGFGLFDLHGNVEEWTGDWYGPYAGGAQVDPVGRADGDFRVTRGGSHGTDPYYLRSANRMGTLPETRNWLIGFRVVQGEAPRTRPLPVFAAKRVLAGNVGGGGAVDMTRPYFRGPLPFVKIPGDAHGPVYAWHNHDTAIAECPNGDLLAIWYTCEQERGRELAVAASRLRKGAAEWGPAEPFWDAPDRNDHCPALWFDGKDTLYHFNGLGVAGRWEPLALVMRTSKDNGLTWSKARLIAAEYGYRNMLGQPVFRTASGAIVMGADANGGSTVWVSRDEGATWADAGGNIRGVHAGVAEMGDGRLVALGRGQNVDGFSPLSISADMGKTWSSSASGVPPLGGGQRLVLMRLKEGPLFLASFAEDMANFGPRANRPKTQLFGALSFDDGKTWPVRRVIGVGGGVSTIDGGWIRGAEPQGYLAGTQARDGAIHLISSWNHYAFNVAWLREGGTVAGVAEVSLERKQLGNAEASLAGLDARKGASFDLTGAGTFVLSVRTGPLTANRYRVVSAGGVVRVAVRPDTVAQVYVDGTLREVLPAEVVIDWRVPARGTFMEWSGEGVRVDLSGAFGPEGRNSR